MSIHMADDPLIIRVLEEGRGEIQGSWQGWRVHQGLPEGRAGILHQTYRPQFLQLRLLRWRVYGSGGNVRGLLQSSGLPNSILSWRFLTGSSFSITARMVLHHMSLSGSMVWRKWRSRCKGWISNWSLCNKWKRILGRVKMDHLPGSQYECNWVCMKLIFYVSSPDRLVRNPWNTPSRGRHNAL